MDNKELKFDELYEKMKDKLVKNGLNYNQIQSKAVKVTLKTLYDEPDSYNSFVEREVIDELEEEKKSLKGEIYKLKREASDLQEKYHDIMKNVKELDKMGINARDEKDGENINYLVAFYKELKNMESPEMRDKFKTAQLYFNTVKEELRTNKKVDEFDLSTFMVTLASLLGGIELKNLNTLRYVPKNEGYYY